jgi:hypothetical protein
MVHIKYVFAISLLFFTLLHTTAQHSANNAYITFQPQNGLRGLVTELRDLVAQGHGDGSDFARRLTMEMEMGKEYSAWSDPVCAEFVQSMKTEVEKIEADDEQDVAEFACSSIERESLMEFFKYLEGLDYSTLADCQAEIYTEMFGERSDIEDMIITLGTPETCLAEVHEEYQLMGQVRKLVASDTSRELDVCVGALVIGGVAAGAAVGSTAYRSATYIVGGTYGQDKAVSFSHSLSTRRPFILHVLVFNLYLYPGGLL